MGKALQTTSKRKPGATAKKSTRVPAARNAAKKRAANSTLRQLNRWLTQNGGLVLQKAKANSVRLIGREVL